MADGANSLVINKINSLDIDENVKKSLVEIFQSEVQYGDASERDIKKRKIKRCREIVTKRANNEDI